jgi:hypothetical protein
MTKSRNILAPRRLWTEDELALIERDFSDTRTDELAQALGRPYSQVAQRAAKMGLKKSQAYLDSPAAHRLDGVKGIGTRFEPGLVPWNKGVKGVVGVQEACRAMQFKKGRPPEEARNYLPIGTVRLSKDGYLERKVTDDPDMFPARRWVGVHRLVWLEAGNEIPAGHVVVFRPGRRSTVADEITVDALELITRVELMKRNTFHRYGPEVAGLVQLRGALTRQINKRSKEQSA